MDFVPVALFATNYYMVFLRNCHIDFKCLYKTALLPAVEQSSHYTTSSPTYAVLWVSKWITNCLQRNFIMCVIKDCFQKPVHLSMCIMLIVRNMNIILIRELKNHTNNSFIIITFSCGAVFYVFSNNILSVAIVNPFVFPPRVVSIH